MVDTRNEVIQPAETNPQEIITNNNVEEHVSPINTEQQIGAEIHADLQAAHSQAGVTGENAPINQEGPTVITPEQLQPPPPMPIKTERKRSFFSLIFSVISGLFNRGREEADNIHASEILKVHHAGNVPEVLQNIEERRQNDIERFLAPQSTNTITEERKAA